MKRIYSFLAIAMTSLGFAQTGTLCSNPIIISSLPYTTTDNTSNYADNYDIASPSTTGPGSQICPGTNGQFPYAGYYMHGNDVIYAYTAAASGTIKIEIPNAVGWTSLYVYGSCADVAVTALACAMSPSTGLRTIDNFPVVMGQTYYIHISSWAAPQTVAYTLNVTQLTLSTAESELAKASVAVYPNPTSEVLNFKSPSEVISAELFSMDGKKLNTMKVANNKINLNGLNSGSYIVTFKTKDGESYNKIFIKK